MELIELDALFRDLEAAPDNEERQRMFTTLGPILDLHRDALRRIMIILREGGHDDVIGRISQDPTLEALLRGYDLIEVDLEGKVNAALETSRPLLKRHGGDVRLLAVRNKVAHLELTGSCHGCASSLVTLKRGIETAIYDQVPELRGIEVAGLTGTTSDTRKWVPLLHTFELKEGQWLKVQAFDEELMVATIDDRPFVFRNRCPAGGEGLEDALFHGLIIECPRHEQRFDLRSGACTTDPKLRLQTCDATIDDAVVKVVL